MEPSPSSARVRRVGGNTMKAPGSSPASIIASARTETSPTTAGSVATVAPQAEPGSRIAAMSAGEMSAE